MRLRTIHLGAFFSRMMLLKSAPLLMYDKIICDEYDYERKVKKILEGDIPKDATGLDILLAEYVEKLKKKGLVAVEDHLKVLESSFGISKEMLEEMTKSYMITAAKQGKLKELLEKNFEKWLPWNKRKLEILRIAGRDEDVKKFKKKIKKWKKFANLTRSYSDSELLRNEKLALVSEKYFYDTIASILLNLALEVRSYKWEAYKYYFGFMINTIRESSKRDLISSDVKRKRITSTIEESVRKLVDTFIGQFSAEILHQLIEYTYKQIFQIQSSNPFGILLVKNEKNLSIEEILDEHVNLIIEMRRKMLNSWDRIHNLIEVKINDALTRMKESEKIILDELMTETFQEITNSIANELKNQIDQIRAEIKLYEARVERVEKWMKRSFIFLTNIGIGTAVFFALPISSLAMILIPILGGASGVLRGLREMLKEEITEKIIHRISKFVVERATKKKHILFSLYSIFHNTLSDKQIKELSDLIRITQNNIKVIRKKSGRTLTWIA